MVNPKIITDLTNDSKRLVCTSCKRKSNMLCQSICMACYFEKFGHMPWQIVEKKSANRES